MTGVRNIFKTQRLRRSAGFTVLELMIASSIFSVILLVLAVGVVSFSNDYYKGVTSSKTQAATRAIMAEISAAMQFSKQITYTPATRANGFIGGVCVDNTLYSFKLGQQVTDAIPFLTHQGYHGLVVSSSANCSSTPPSVPASSALPLGSRELLGQHMRLNTFTVTSSGTLYTLHIRVIFGDDDLLLPAVSPSTDFSSVTELCTALKGSQYCATSDLTTTVERRLL